VQDSVFIVRAYQPITATDENSNVRYFEAVGFQLTLPPTDDAGYQSLSIAIDNVSRRVLQFVETAKSEKVPVEMVYRPFLSTDLSRPQMIPPLVLYLKDIRINNLQVTGKATFMDVVNKKFPSELYNRDRFPSLG
jgi:hypothetical protein